MKLQHHLLHNIYQKKPTKQQLLHRLSSVDRNLFSIKFFNTEAFKMMWMRDFGLCCLVCKYDGQHNRKKNLCNNNYCCNNNNMKLRIFSWDIFFDCWVVLRNSNGNCCAGISWNVGGFFHLVVWVHSKDKNQKKINLATKCSLCRCCHLIKQNEKLTTTADATDRQTDSKQNTTPACCLTTGGDN